MPATLSADGSVPWGGEHGGEAEFATPPQHRRPVDPGAAPCRARALTARLPRWAPKLLHDDEGKLVGNTGLLGMVDVRNTSTTACTLRGEVPVTLRAGGAPVDMTYVHRVNDAGRNQTTTMRPGDRATLRLDWSSPFCGDAGGRQVLTIDLPQGGGTLRAAVARPGRPICSADGVTLRSSVLAAGVFDEPPRTTELNSPLNRLRVRMHARGQAVAGRTLRYEVVLRNPTARPIALRPCPGYLQERFSLATAAGDEAVDDAQVYRLNCRPVASVPAHGAIRFQMRVEVPDGLRPGRRFSVTWRLLGPRTAGSESLIDELALAVR